MLPELLKLISLQEVDLEIRDLVHSQQELPQTMHELEAKLAELQARAAEKQQELEETKKQQRQLQQEMDMLDEGITRSRQRLMEIKDNIEYKAMLKEIAFKEDRKDQKETEVLEILEQVEALTAALAALQEEIDLRQAHLEKLRAEVAAELAAQEAKITALQGQRQQIQQDIPPTLLKRYDFIREKRQGLAIAEVRQGVCQACHMNLPPQKFIELQMDLELMTCPHCQRIIYFVPQEENGSANPAEAA
ncbi:MAG: zinc ribbon domain-containing protein [Desulfobacca sp.]|uniref:zinc ribbon domain-containing protein n=1 Tax=Desulfobacca sp. TaxID=2067990 RepID=UPI0040496A8B